MNDDSLPFDDDPQLDADWDDAEPLADELVEPPDWQHLDWNELDEASDDEPDDESDFDPTDELPDWLEKTPGEEEA